MFQLKAGTDFSGLVINLCIGRGKPLIVSNFDNIKVELVNNQNVVQATYLLVGPATGYAITLPTSSSVEFNIHKEDSINFTLGALWARITFTKNSMAGYSAAYEFITSVLLGNVNSWVTDFATAYIASVNIPNTGGGWSAYPINALGGYLVKTGPGQIDYITILQLGINGNTVTIYDGVDNTGRVIVPASKWNINMATLFIGDSFTTGLYIVVASGNPPTLSIRYK